MPFNVVSNPVFCRHMKHAIISYPSLLKYMERLITVVEKKITKILPSKFALVVDCWSSSRTHFFAVFALFPASNELEYDTVLLGFSPFENKENMNAANHVSFLKCVLDVYGKSFENVAALIADNCAVNISFGRMIGCRFIGSASHRYNLAMRGIISGDSELIEKIRKWMQKLGNPVPAAKLRRYTHLAAKCSNANRWTSTADMLLRYKQIRSHLEEIMVDELDSLIPSARENRRIDALVDKFQELNSVTLALQRDSVSCADIRLLFDEVMKSYPDTRARLGTDAEIVSFPEFEKVVVKVLNDDQQRLT